MCQEYLLQTNLRLSVTLPQLLEPCTELVVMVTEEHLGAVLSDLSSSRRAQVKEVTVAKDTMVIRALAPLATLVVSTHTLTLVGM